MDLSPALDPTYTTFFSASPLRERSVDLPPSMRVKLDRFAHTETDRA